MSYDYIRWRPHPLRRSSGTYIILILSSPSSNNAVNYPLYEEFSLNDRPRNRRFPPFPPFPPPRLIYADRSRAPTFGRCISFVPNSFSKKRRLVLTHGPRKKPKQTKGKKTVQIHQNQSRSRIFTVLKPMSRKSHSANFDSFAV